MSGQPKPASPARDAVPSRADLVDMLVEAVPELTKFVSECNNFENGKNLAAGHGYICLPDERGNIKIFGVLQPKVLDTVRWNNHGFLRTTVGAVRGGADQRVTLQDDIKGDVKIVIPKSGSIPEAITSRFIQIAETSAYHESLPGLKEWSKKRSEGREEYMPLVMGHPLVKVPDAINVHFGMLQIGTHLTVYTMKGDSLETICVQRRSKKSKYPRMLDQTAAGGLSYGEDVRKALLRETSEEVSEELRIKAVNAPHHGNVVFSMVRTQDAGPHAGALEISAKVCFSLKAEKQADIMAPVGGNDEVEGWNWLSVETILKKLKSREFKPNSGLVMIRFLIDKLINEVDESGMDGDWQKAKDAVSDLENSLKPDLILPLPGDLSKYSSATAS